ncbi:MAG TPA: hypothetical protein VG621_03105 [Candidatus Paceibacterota bacterium]|nr:hypothetical protein [Candidatus Paceibacterota bacterium]
MRKLIFIGLVFGVVMLLLQIPRKYQVSSPVKSAQYTEHWMLPAILQPRHDGGAPVVLRNIYPNVYTSWEPHFQIGRNAAVVATLSLVPRLG